MIGTFLTAAIFAAPAPQIEPRPAPGAPAPILTVVRMSKDGNLVQRVDVQVQVPREEEREINVQGRVVKENRIVLVTETRQEERTLAIKGVQVLAVAGKRVDPVKLQEVLKNDTLVLFSADGKPVDPYYLALFKEGTLVLVLPPQPLRSGLPDVPPERLPRPR